MGDRRGEAALVSGYYYVSMMINKMVKMKEL